MIEPESVSSVERTLRQRLLGSFRRTFSAATSRILVGFSGGNDSLALALLLKGIQPALNLDVRLLHVDHRMRPESGHDAARAVELANVIGLPIDVLTSDIVPQDRFPGIGPEEAARRVRYDLMSSRARDEDVVAVAHHAGDQAETVLLHILRGSGIDGLAGMLEVSELTVPWWPGSESSTRLTVWRPLLAESKHDLVELVSSHGLVPVEDPSNADTHFRRNMVRHGLLSVMRDIEPTIEARLGVLSRLAADEADLLESLARETLISCGAGPSLARAAVDRAHPALARRIIRMWLREQYGFEPTFERVEAVRALSARNVGGATIELGEHLEAWIDRTSIHVDARSDRR